MCPPPLYLSLCSTLTSDILHVCSHAKSKCQSVFFFLTLTVILLQIINTERFVFLPQGVIGWSREPLSSQSLPKNVHVPATLCSHQEPSRAAMPSRTGSLSPGLGVGLIQRWLQGSSVSMGSSPGTHQLASVASLVWRTP